MSTTVLPGETLRAGEIKAHAARTDANVSQSSSNNRRGQMSADHIFLVGRILLGGMFVVAGLRHLMIAPVLTLAVAARGVPFSRAVLLAGTGFQIVAGLALVLGFCIAWAALGLILFTVVASVLLVNFWDKEGEEQIALTNAFQTNIGLIGGLMLAAAYGLRP